MRLVPPMPLQFATASASPRPHSEDRVDVHHVEGGLVVVVADGAGGLTGGGRAAELALEVVAEAIEAPLFSPFTAAGLFTAHPWVEVLLRADDQIAADPVAGETTLVVVAVAEDGAIVGASCGDSGAMVIGLGAGGVMDVVDDSPRASIASAAWARVGPRPWLSSGQSSAAPSSWRRTASSPTRDPRCW